MPKRTYNPSKRRRATRHGFRSRSTAVLTRRRKKGRARLAPTA